MKAIVTNRYGPPDSLQLTEVDQPTPGENEVLVAVHAAAVNAGDWLLVRGKPFLVRLFFGLTAPKFRILGSDVAGQVEAVGRNVRKFRRGDHVFGDLSGCGFGGFAEYVCAPESALLPAPAGLPLEHAASLSVSAVTALQGLRDEGKIQSGQRVLIVGASGGVGTFAVQLAKAFGAHVTGVCSTSKVSLVRSIGADIVIDYSKNDFTKNGQVYDLILAVGGDRSMLQYRRSLAPGGRYVMVGGSTRRMFQALLAGPLLSIVGQRKFRALMSKPNTGDLGLIRKLVETGRIKPVIDRTYRLDEVPQAIRYVEEGRARGKVVIRVRGAATT